MLNKFFKWLGYVPQSSLERLEQLERQLEVLKTPSPIKLVENRRAGNTTRIADFYIQRLFNNYTTGEIVDHYGSTESNKRLFKIIVGRLDREHSWILKDLHVDHNHRIISIKGK
jgi:hypothetical protein